jgi:hypothetical protein
LPRQSLTLPRGLEGANPLCVKIFLEKSLPPKRLSCFLTILVTEPRETNKSACKWQGRPSRGIPTPPGYGYLTRHLPRKITLTWVSNPATNERVRIRETGGKETQLHNTTTVCLGLGGRKKHTHTTDKMSLQVQTSIGGSSSTLGVNSTFGGIRPGLGRRHGQRISTSKEDVSTMPGPSSPGSPPGTRPEQTARPAAP